MENVSKSIIFTQGEINRMEEAVCTYPISSANCVNCIQLIGMIAEKRSMDFVGEMLLKEIMWENNGLIPELNHGLEAEMNVEDDE